jgi:hypothetical protein
MAYGKSFNSIDYIKLEPTDRYELRIFNAWERTDDYKTDEEFLKRVRSLKANLVALYKDLKPDEEYGPHTKDFMAWLDKFDVATKGSTNAYAIGCELLEELVMVMRENGLIGGDNVVGKAVISDGEMPKELEPNDEELD